MTSELFSFDEVLSRLKKSTESDSDTKLALNLGLSQGSISGAKQKRKIPPGWIVSVATTFGVSADWLLSGNGPMKRGVSPEDAQAAVGASGCARCATLEVELHEERGMNRDMVAENRQLWKENGELKVKIGELNVQKVKLEGELDTARTMAKEYYERLKARAAPEEETPPEATRDCA
jgi:hypothetical protein